MTKNTQTKKLKQKENIKTEFNFFKITLITLKIPASIISLIFFK